MRAVGGVGKRAAAAAGAKVVVVVGAAAAVAAALGAKAAGARGRKIQSRHHRSRRRSRPHNRTTCSCSRCYLRGHSDTNPLCRLCSTYPFFHLYFLGRNKVLAESRYPLQHSSRHLCTLAVELTTCGCACRFEGRRTASITVAAVDAAFVAAFVAAFDAARKRS